MDHEKAIRIVLIAGSAILIPIMAWFRIRSHTGESLDRRREGLFILVGLRLTGVAAMLGFLTWLYDPALMKWAAVNIPSAARWIGVPIGAVSAMLFIITMRTLGGNLTDTVVTREHHTLVTSGPYRYVRHPFYVAFALAVIANTLATANGFIGAAASICFALIVLRTQIEEEQLIQRFGADYRDYITTTGRFVPRR